MSHDHDDNRLTIGCHACIMDVRLDQDFVAALEGRHPDRVSQSKRHINALVFMRAANGKTLGSTITWLERWIGCWDEAHFLHGLHAAAFAQSHPRMVAAYLRAIDGSDIHE